MNVAKPGRRARVASAVAAVAAIAASLACAPAGAADMNAVNHAGAIASSVTVGSAAP
ncbi:TPA: flagellar biosynthesis protein FliO, partial [Burkholderia cepacia ATCC 25416]|nr:flagellar biosynthesis protein FliO [Burkholderia cepacia ATCC 25416]